MSCTDSKCNQERESKMIMAAPDAWCDPCIANLVAALNTHGLQTVASCCGHGYRPGNIVLEDGRELIIARNFEEARQIDSLFPIDINGENIAYKRG